MRRIKKMCYYLGICIFLSLCGGCKEKEQPKLQEIREEELQEDTEEIKNEKNELTKEKLVVYVCGEVKNPGVYELEAGSRLYEALNAAGGVTKKAAPTYLNQAELLEDGEQIYVPAQDEIQEKDTEKTSGNPGKSARDDGKINLNTASKEELLTLPGIGEAKAQSIISYREEHGKFGAAEEIMNIEGIKDGVFNKIKEQIIVK